MIMEIIRENERIDDLMVNGLRLIQHVKGFCFGTDAVELANFLLSDIKGAKETNGKIRVCDLGCGSGIIPILLAGKKGLSVTGVEVQENMAQLAIRNAQLNNLGGLVTIENIAMQQFIKGENAGAFDMVISNPPYRKIGTGEESRENTIFLSRHESLVTLAEVAGVAAHLLGTGGKFYLIHQTERMAEVICECEKRALQPKVLQILVPCSVKSPHLFMLKCIKDGKTGLNVLKERVVGSFEE